MVTFTKLAAGGFGIFNNGKLVGKIEKTTEEIERPVKGTTLRYAKGKVVPKFEITLFGKYFPGAPKGFGTGFGPIRSLVAAKIAATEEIERYSA